MEMEYSSFRGETAAERFARFNRREREREIVVQPAVISGKCPFISFPIRRRRRRHPPSLPPSSSQVEPSVLRWPDELFDTLFRVQTVSRIRNRLYAQIPSRCRSLLFRQIRGLSSSSANGGRGGGVQANTSRARSKAHRASGLFYISGRTAHTYVYAYVYVMIQLFPPLHSQSI